MSNKIKWRVGVKLDKKQNAKIYKFNNKNSSKVKKVFSVNERIGRFLIVFSWYSLYL